MPPRVLQDQAPRIHAGVVGEQAGDQVRRVVRLQPRALVGRHRERGRVRLAEPEARELRHGVPDLLGGLAVDPAFGGLARGTPRGTPAASPRGRGGAGCGRRRSRCSRRAPPAFGSPARGRRSPRTSPAAAGADRGGCRSGAPCRRAGAGTARSCRTSPARDGTARCRRSGPPSGWAAASAAARAGRAIRSGSSRACRSARISSNVSARRRARSRSRSTFSPVVRAISSSAWRIELSMRTPRMSSFR